jgi:Cft2 family RNA processing exonuclease
VLNRSTFSDTFKYPTALITATSAYEPTLEVETIGSSDKELMGFITSQLTANRNVLVPTDGVGRCLELLARLDNLWRPQLPPLVLLAGTGGRVVQTCLTLLEFMHEKWTRAFVDASAATNKGGGSTIVKNPMGLTHTKIVSSIEELERTVSMRSGACVLCPFSSGDLGPSRELLIKWSVDRRCTVFVTGKIQRTPPSLLTYVYDVVACA